MDCETDDHDGEYGHSDDCDDGRSDKEKHSGKHETSEVKVTIIVNLAMMVKVEEG